MAYFIQGAEYPVIFLANPRTASTSIGEALLSMGAQLEGNHHAPPAEIPEGTILAQTIRHHCDVLVSFWYKGGRGIPLDKYVQMVLDGGHRYLGPDNFYSHWSCEPNFILRYETLDYEWQNFCLITGLPEVPLVQTPTNRPPNIKWQSLFAPRLLNAVLERYREEMEELGYGRDGVGC